MPTHSKIRSKSRSRAVDSTRRVPYSGPMIDTDTQVRDALNRFVDDVSQLMQLAALQTIEEALGTSGAKGVKRSADELAELSERLLGYLKAHPGQRIEQIAEGMATTTKELSLPLKRLTAKKRVIRKGQKRATTYAAK
jgi:hypothetical protein